MKIFDLDRWEEIWATIAKNKWRSFLTAMGVFWGIFMLTIMIGAGGGLEGMISHEVGGFNVNSAFFYSRATSIPYKGFRTPRYYNFNDGDLVVIKNNIAGIENIAGISFGRQVNAVRKDKKNAYNTIGYMPEYNKINPQILRYGRYINEVDMIERRKVCMLGIQVYKELFNPGEDPVGEVIQLGKSYFTIIGVNEAMSNINMFSNPATTIIIPFSTMQQLYNKGDRVDYMAITGQKDTDIRTLENGICDILRARHNISPDDTKAIGYWNLKEEFDIFNNLFFGIGFLTWIVGIGTLLAGMVGISNIMLVVVRERTQEIGVRRALGAKPSAIISQIVSESFVLTLIAGIAGLTLGVGILSIADSLFAAQAAQAAQMGQQSTSISTQISFGTGMIALMVLVLGGLLAGVIPASRAMSISPVDAIREE